MINWKKKLLNIKKNIKDPKKGLPEEVFLFVTELTPMVNVDLLIKDEKGRILLAWRDDKLSGRGWHIPGGIIRYKELFESRVEQVAINEIGTIVNYNPKPIDINQIIIPNQNTRGHFISLLYDCQLSSDYILPNKKKNESDAGFLKWYKNYPSNFLEVQKIYKKYFIKDEVSAL